MSSIAILGAGPAGTSTAIQLCKNGHDVVLLDRAQFPRHFPGETLHPGIEPLMEQLGVLSDVQGADFIRHTGIENVRGGVSTFEAYNEHEHWAGFQFNRDVFDSLLLNHAISLGVRFYGNESPTRVNKEGDRVRSIETKHHVFDADFFIDATGKKAWLANKLGMEFHNHSPKRLAHYGYVENSDYEVDNPKLIWDEQGWTWISKVKNNRKAWVRLSLKQHEKLASDWMPEMLADGVAVGPRKVADVTWRKAETSCLGNCFLAGDAAFVLDPGASHGVLKAIMSGMLVSHLICKTDSFPSSFIESHYNNWIDEQFNGDVFMLNEMYREFEANY